MFKLVISDDEGKQTVVPLVRDEITIGRKEGNTIRLTERNISRRHARLMKANGRFLIEDLHSYNGVRVNGQRIGGETPLDPGDQIQIGDYQLALQVEGSDAQTMPEHMSPHAAPRLADAETAMIAAPGPPARLVMITPPAPGAEFAMTSERVRVGRAEDLDIWVNHRSISREHAEIQKEPDGHFRLIDLGSANGVRVNGQDVQNAVLTPGDVVELGQVRFRFVGPGEHYAFDADRTVQMDAVPLSGPSSNRLPLFVALAIVGLAIIGAGIVAFWGSSEPETTARPMDTGHNDPVPPTVPQGESYPQALTACQTALSAGRYAEAIAHADVALRERPGDAAATACRTSAMTLSQQEQTYNTGMAQFERGELEAAYFTLDNLPTESPFRARPQFANVVQGYARMQLEAAHSMLDTDPTEAHRISQFVLNMQGISPPQRGQASQYEHQARANQTRHASATTTPRTRTPETPRTPTKRTTTTTPVETPTPRETQTEDSSDTTDAQVRQCAMRGDNPCIIRLLEGRARSQGQLAQLIEAYRARGQTSQAVRHMRTFVQRFPSTPRARSYQQILARQGGP